MRITLPNQITLGRLVLAVVFFALLSRLEAGQIVRDRWLLEVCFWMFLVAALADVLDGFLARWMRQVTTFGRIVDPVVDKVMVCGAFVYFSSEHFYDGVRGVNLTGVAPWMVVVVLVRELLVSAIRSYSESAGQDFSANVVGKFKMFVQSATVCVVLGVLAWYPESLAWLRVTCIWATVGVTGLSILSYVQRAYAFMLSSTALGGPDAHASQESSRSRLHGGPEAHAPQERA